MAFTLKHALRPLCLPLQADLLALPLPGQHQRQGLWFRPLLPPHTGAAGRQPLPRLLVAGARRHLRRGPSPHGATCCQKLVGLTSNTAEKKKKERETVRYRGNAHGCHGNTELEYRREVWHQSVPSNLLDSQNAAAWTDTFVSMRYLPVYCEKLNACILYEYF